MNYNSRNLFQLIRFHPIRGKRAAFISYLSLLYCNVMTYSVLKVMLVVFAIPFNSWKFALLTSAYVIPY